MGKCGCKCECVRIARRLARLPRAAPLRLAPRSILAWGAWLFLPFRFIAFSCAFTFSPLDGTSEREEGKQGRDVPRARA